MYRNLKLKPNLTELHDCESSRIFMRHNICSIQRITELHKEKLRFKMKPIVGLRQA